MDCPISFVPFSFCLICTPSSTCPPAIPLIFSPTLSPRFLFRNGSTLKAALLLCLLFLPTPLLLPFLPSDLGVSANIRP